MFETRRVRIPKLTRAFRVNKKAIQKARGSNFKYVSNITIIEFVFFCSLLSTNPLGFALALGVVGFETCLRHLSMILVGRRKLEKKYRICTVPMRKGFMFVFYLIYFVLLSNSLIVKYHYKQSPDNANYYFSGINR